MNLNSYKRPKWMKGTFKALSVIATLTMVFNMTSVAALVTPRAAHASEVDPEVQALNLNSVQKTSTTGAVCPDGDVKLNIGDGYEYTDNTATITGNGTKVTWTSANGYEIVDVCVKIGGPDGGSLVNPDPADGSYTTNSYDISHVVVTTQKKANYNPPLGQACGIDIGLVIDSSGSIDNTELNQMKSAYRDFVDAFLVDRDTPTQFSVTEFDTNVVPPSLNFTGDVAAIKADINAAASGGFTNWEAALGEAHSLFATGTPKPDLLLFASDGNPNTTLSTSGGAASEATAVAAAVTKANAIKASGIRIVALGIGNNLDVANLQAISGDNVNTAGLTADVITTNFSGLADTLAKFASDICGGTILIQKQIDLDGDGQPEIDGSQANAALSGYQFNVNGIQKSTDNTGYLQFDVDAGNYDVWEYEKAGTIITNAYCTMNGQPVGQYNESTRKVEGIPMEYEDTVSCTFVNHPQQCDLKVTKKVDKQNVKPGDTLTYTIEYVNEGDAFCTGGGVKLYDEFKNEAGKPGLTYVSGSAKILEVLNDQDLHAGDPAPQVYPNDFNGTSDKLLGNLHEIGPNESGKIELKATVNSGDYCDSWKVWNSGWTDGVEAESDVQFQSEQTTVTSPCEGTLKVKKYVDVGGLTPDNWEFTVGNQTKKPASGTNYVEFTLPAGTYTATESTVPGYHQVSTTCTDVQVQPNQQAMCEFHNAMDIGKLTVVKHVEGSTEPASSWTMKISNATAQVASFPGDENGTSRNLPAGNYTVTESATPAGYTLTYSGACDQNGNVEIKNNDDKTCVLTNTRDTGSVEVHKVYDMDGNPQTTDDVIEDPDTWTWNLVGVENNIAAGATKTLLTEVEYSITENADNLYNSSWICDNGRSGQGIAINNFSVDKGEHVKCVFNNIRKFGEVKFEKDVASGNAVPSAWTFKVDGVTYSHNQTVSLPTGTYTVTEYGPDGYTHVSSSGICANGSNGQATLTVTENGGTCTFTNARDTGDLRIKKFNDHNANGVKDNGDEYLTGWEFNVENEFGDSYHGYTGDNGDYLVFTDVPTGSYEITEVAQNGWTNTTPITVDTSVTKDKMTTVYFGNFELGKIEGYKLDQNQQGVAGWDICIEAASYAKTCTQTDKDGHYEFTGLPYGTYTVTEGAKQGWIQLSPVANNGTHLVDITSGMGYGSEPIMYTFVNQQNEFKVSIEKTADATVEAGDEMTFTLDWEITGNTTVYDAVIHDLVPANTSFVSASNGGTENLGTVTWNLGTVNPNDSGTVTLTVKVDAPLADGTIVYNSAQICAAGDIEDNEWFSSLPNGSQQGYPVKCDDDDTTTEVNSDFTVTIDKSAPETVEAGTEMIYTLDWTTSGNAPIDELIITDALPANTSFVSASNGGTNNAGLVTWNLGAQTPGATGTVTMTVLVDSPLFNNTEIDNTGKICGTSYTRTEEEVIEHCDDDTTTTTVESNPILSVEKTNDKDVVEPTETIHYRIDWGVAGNSIATNVTLVDTIPSELVIDEASISDAGVWDGTTRTITWDFGNQAPGAAGFVTYEGYVAAPVANGTEIVNVAKLSADNTDPQFVEDDSVVTVASAPVLELVKSVDIGNDLGYVNPGDTVTYTVVVTNTGTDTVVNVNLTDTLPDGFLFADSLTPTKLFVLGDLEVGASISTSYDVIVGANVEEGFYDNLAVATADNHSPVDDTATVEVRVPDTLSEKTEPRINLTKSVDVAFTNPGGTVEYTLTVSLDNTGDAEALDIKLSDILPEGFTFEDGTTTRVWNLNAVPAGESRTVTYKVKVANSVTAGTYYNKAVAETDDQRVEASAPVEVRVPKVLGETVPNTGAGMDDLGIFIASLLMIIAGALFINEGRKRVTPAQDNLR